MLVYLSFIDVHHAAKRIQYVCMRLPRRRDQPWTPNTRPIPWRDTRCWYAELKKETNTCTQCKYLAFGTFARCVWLLRYLSSSFCLPSSSRGFDPGARQPRTSEYRARVWIVNGLKSNDFRRRDRPLIDTSRRFIKWPTVISPRWPWYLWSLFAPYVPSFPRWMRGLFPFFFLYCYFRHVKIHESL